MILERVPEKWLNEDECENSICFKKYAKTEFDSWQVGRIFDSDKEFRWSWNGERFQVIYTGCALHLPELSPMNTQNWEPSKPAQYLLWGTRFESHESPYGFTYLELQIPRLLCYPISQKDKKRAFLKVIEYRDKISGQIVHYRFSTWRKTK